MYIHLFHYTCTNILNALYILYRWLYWCDYGSDHIQRASLDGNSRTVLHNTSISKVYAITLDYDNQVLYWADYDLNKIESSNVDGSNRRVLSTSVIDPYGIIFYNGFLLWGDLSFNRILRGPASAPGSGTYIGGGFSYGPYHIHVISKDLQPLG